jgi:hypothetical protein
MMIRTHRLRLARATGITSCSSSTTSSSPTDPEYYSDWDDSDVFEEIENQGLKLKRSGPQEASTKADRRVDREGPGGRSRVTGGDDGGDDYDDEDVWSDKDLAAEYKKRGLDTIEGKKNRQKVIAALRADDAGGDDDDPFAD